jgi:beta-phosphoglucomutase
VTAAPGRRPPAALLFDLDGTLVETDPLHHAAFNAVLAGTGRAIGWDDYVRRIMGAPNVETFAWLFPDATPEARAAAAARKEALFRDALGAAEPRPGIGALLDAAAAAGVAVAVVTNAPRPNAEATLRAIGLRDRFSTLVIGDEMERPKPHPDPYLAAMRALGVAPADSVAFEDSLSGVRAAVAAGAETFALRGPLPDAALLEVGAVAVIDDFADPALWERLGLA